METIRNLEHYFNQYSDLIAGSEATVACNPFLIVLHRLSLQEGPLSHEEEEILKTSMNSIKKKWGHLQWDPVVRSHGIKLLQTWSLYKLSHRFSHVNEEQTETLLHTILQRCCNEDIYDPLMELTQLIHALIEPSEAHQTTWAITRDHLVLKQRKWNIQKPKKRKEVNHRKTFLLIGFVCAAIMTGYAYQNYHRFNNLIASYGQHS